ncbi:MAG: hypothetical protein BGO98_27630 [Myxococcales bacterium 68-20]|nr:MAG: hypothetical protein BGO98_27630 [Myxococcales bacterium 68-20]
MAPHAARVIVLSSLAFSLLAACGAGNQPVAGTTAPRESGQSRLIEKTFAGKDRCNPQDHTRPFVIEWDGTDISSFESRATTDIVFVRYEGCNLQVVDSCTNDDVRGSLGAYGPVDWTSGAVEKVDILNEDELYAKLPLGANTIGARVQGGERFHMEYFVSGTRKATRPAVYRGDVDKLRGCRGVTHYVYAYNVGAFALGSFSRLEGSAGATVWGIGAGGSKKNENAIEKQGGVLGSCRGESASEVATCKVPIRLALREIEPGDSPDAQAAVAPETPDALNLAGKIQQDNTRSREANERLASAQRKANARDGKGCLTELDAFDRLEKRPGAQSTEAKGLGFLRAQCLMLAGQCSAGRELSRRSMEARGTGESASAIDRQVDGQVGMACGTGAKEPRDQLLVALHVLNEGASRERTTPKACLAAIDSGSLALPKVQPRDEEDRAVKGAARTLAEYGTKCLARAGDCPTAWKRFPTLQDQWIRAENLQWRTEAADRRSSFESATYGECVGKDSGPLSPVEELALADKQLDWAASHSTTVATVALCKGLIARGKRALASLRDDRSDYVKLGGRSVGKQGALCLAKAGDCSQARAHFIEQYRAERPDRSMLDAEDAYAGALGRGACVTTLEAGKLPPADAVANALRVLREGRGEPKSCAPAWNVLKSTMPGMNDAALRKKYEHEIHRRPLDCFDAALDCNAAWTAYKTANAWRSKPLDDRELRASFTSFASKCVDTTAPGLSAAEQYWAAISQLERNEKKSKDKCRVLYQTAKRTSSAVTLRKGNSQDDPDYAYATCLGRAGDCAGTREAVLRSPGGRDARWVEQFVTSTCKNGN